MTITTFKQYPDMFLYVRITLAYLNCSEFSVIHIKIEVVVKLSECIASVQEYPTYFES
jgi:hypothetical protein